MKSQSKEETETRKTKSERKDPQTQCCCPEGRGVGGSESMSGMMTKCCEHAKSACRWFPLIPILLAGSAFLLGYYLNPEAVRMLWLTFSGLVILVGIVGFTVAHTAYRA